VSWTRCGVTKRSTAGIHGRGASAPESATSTCQGGLLNAESVDVAALICDHLHGGCTVPYPEMSMFNARRKVHSPVCGHELQTLWRHRVMICDALSCPPTHVRPSMPQRASASRVVPVWQRKCAFPQALWSHPQQHIGVRPKDSPKAAFRCGFSGWHLRS
jgi:hypothetical protein